MKKVCIVTTVHPLFDTRIFHKEAKYLIRAGYDVTLIAQNDKDEVIDGIKISSLLKPKNRLSRIFLLTKRAYSLALKECADVYHFHDPELLPWMLLLKYKTGAKIIYDVHEDYQKQILSKHWIYGAIRKSISYIFNIIEKSISRNFDYIITATDSIASNFKQKNVVVLNNYPIVNERSVSHKVIDSTDFTVVYVGGLTKIRGIKEIIESIEYIKSKKEVKLKLIGNFSEKDFETELKNMPEWSKIEYLGYLPKKDTLAHLINADAGIVCFWPEPNHIEAMPNKMFEYMEAGLPIIASDFSLWRKIINDANCGVIVNPLNPKDIARGIQYLIDNSGKATEMGENGRKAILEKYNWKIEEKKLLSLYGELS